MFINREQSHDKLYHSTVQFHFSTNISNDGGLLQSREAFSWQIVDGQIDIDCGFVHSWRHCLACEFDDFCSHGESEKIKGKLGQPIHSCHNSSGSRVWSLVCLFNQVQSRKSRLSIYDSSDQIIFLIFQLAERFLPNNRHQWKHSDDFHIYYVHDHDKPSSRIICWPLLRRLSCVAILRLQINGIQKLGCSRLHHFRNSDWINVNLSLP